MHYLSGLNLYRIAVKRAVELGIFNDVMKMEPLIHTIQEQEGNSPCFRTTSTCKNMNCCWWAACQRKIFK